jgi:hypothetical protein
MSACRSCGAEIEWARTESGKLIPLDVGEVEDGNLVIEGGVARVRRGGLDADLPRRRSHFARCPFARQHRKAR